MLRACKEFLLIHFFFLKYEYYPDWEFSNCLGSAMHKRILASFVMKWFFISPITTSVFLYSFIQKTTQPTNEINYQLVVANNRMTEMVNPPIFQQKLNLVLEERRQIKFVIIAGSLSQLQILFLFFNPA